MMLRIVLFFTVWMITFNICNAQIVASSSDNEYGIIGGLNYQMFHTTVFSPSYQPSVNVGAYYRRHCEDVSFEFGALIGSQTKYKINPSTPAVAVNADARSLKDTFRFGSYSNTYIYLPAMVDFNIGKKFYIQYGLEYTYLVQSAYNKGVDDRSKNFRDDIFKKGETSLITGVDYHVHKVNLSLRYSLGLRNLNDYCLHYANSSWHLYSLQAMVSYAFSR